MRISDWSSDGVLFRSLLVIAVVPFQRDVDDDIVPVHMDHDRFGHQRCFGAVEIFDEGGDPALVVKLNLVPFGMESSEERRVGKACVSTCRSRWSLAHYRKKQSKA